MDEQQIENVGLALAEILQQLSKIQKVKFDVHEPHSRNVLEEQTSEIFSACEELAMLIPSE